MNIKVDAPIVGEGTHVRQAGDVIYNSLLLEAAVDNQRIRKLKDECGLAEASLERMPGDPYWCQKLTDSRNELRELNALAKPSWMKSQEVA